MYHRVPYIFLLYVNDMPSAIKCELVLYADVSVIQFTHGNISIINDQLNREFNSLYVSGLWIINLVYTLEKTRQSQSISYSSRRHSNQATFKSNLFGMYPGCRLVWSVNGH